MIRKYYAIEPYMWKSFNSVTSQTHQNHNDISLFVHNIQEGGKIQMASLRENGHAHTISVGT